MDLTIKMEDTYLNIRVVVILETENGFVLQKHKRGNYFFIGGRIKIGESSLQAAKREMLEETGLDLNLEDFKFVSTIENFYEHIEKVHEICFVYKTEKQEKVNFENAVEAKNENFNPIEIPKDKLADLDIRPEIIKKLILENKLEQISHYIV